MRSHHSGNLRRRGKVLTNMLSFLAMVISLVSLFLTWTFQNNLRLTSSPGGAYIVFCDHDGKFQGSIADDYGKLKITGVDAARDGQTELILGGQGGASITLYKADVPTAKWTLSEDGEKFEKNPTR